MEEYNNMKGKYYCEICNKVCPAYYTLSLLTKGLWIECPQCGTHALPFVTGLNIQSKPSKHYLKTMGIKPIHKIAIKNDFQERLF